MALSLRNATVVKSALLFLFRFRQQWSTACGLAQLDTARPQRCKQQTPVPMPLVYELVGPISVIAVMNVFHATTHTTITAT